MQFKSIITTVILSFVAITIGVADEFADSVLSYDCTSGGQCPSSQYQDTDQILGSNDGDFLSLGFGGIVEVQFDDNLLTNSGDANDDLFIYELGADVEDTRVSIRPTPATAAFLGPSFDADGDGFYEIGTVSGGVSSIDIDVIFGSFNPETLAFDGVQLIDDDFESSGSGTHGADIDAVQALSFVLFGDINNDGQVDLLDVTPFITVISSDSYDFAADLNQDGAVNLLDVKPFVALIAD